MIINRKKLLHSSPRFLAASFCKIYHPCSPRSQTRLSPITSRSSRPNTSNKPIKDAKTYVLSYTVHDWPDKHCKTILEFVRDAMKPTSSRILLNDAILPDKNYPLIAAMFDITMMFHHTGLERSEQMWKDLITGLHGLEIVKSGDPPVSGEGAIVIRTA